MRCATSTQKGFVTTSLLNIKKMKHYLLTPNSRALYIWNVRYNELMRVANCQANELDYRFKALRLAIKLNSRLNKCRQLKEVA
jgi:hypothetical protein